MLEPVNLFNVIESFKENFEREPFSHCVIDNFFYTDVAAELSKEFMDYNDPRWFYYDNPIENKKTCNDWHAFPKLTYSVFSYLTGEDFCRWLQGVMGTKRLYPDPGLHGGGWHMHGPGGKLNPHFDYSMHPKMDLQRCWNIIVYLSKDLKTEHGGHLGFWSHDEETSLPKELVKEIEPKFNRAVIFNTTQNSWHGLSRALTQPEGIYRKSIAVYYLKDPDKNADTRKRALFAPTEDQKGNENVLELIKLRSQEETSKEVYRVKK